MDAGRKDVTHQKWHPERCASDERRDAGRKDMTRQNGSKTLIYRDNLTARSHKTDPSVAREIIDKNNVVALAPLGSKGSGTPYIRMDQIKRTLRNRLTSRIG
jgi:hypothetical protein